MENRESLGSATKIFALTCLVLASIWMSTSDTLAATPAEYTVEALVAPDADRVIGLSPK
jgi:hypothetical protein